MMKLVPYEAKNIKHYKSTKNLEILEEFIESDMSCAKLEGYTQKNAKNCQSSLLGAIKRFHIHGVKVLVRKEDVILLKVDE